ncbi:MAG: hypothetical protein AAFO63_01760 [Pseudomonadota bacterium]
MPYRSLNGERIVDSIRKVTDRIENRFGGRGLTQISRELETFAEAEVGRAKSLARPRFLLRGLTFLVVLAAISSVVWLGWRFGLKLQAEASLEMFEGVEALINILILSAAGIYFLMNLEARVKRHDVLTQLNQLRSIAHIIDMHQVSKDPIVDLHVGATSEAEPGSELNGYELVRYLDYCAKLVTLTGKLAAVYLEYIEDPIVISSVNDFESLTGEMARKIWQKVTVLELQGASEIRAADSVPEPRGKPKTETDPPVPDDLPPGLC